MTTDTQQTLDNTRRMANEALERAQGAASRGMHAMSGRAAAAQRYMGDYASRGTRYVADHPLQSALVAVVVGAAVAGLVLAMRNRADDDRYF